MAVKSAPYVMIKGQKLIATYDEESGLWTAEGTAPAESSWSQPDHVFKAEIHAEDLAGNSTVMTSDDKVYGNELKFRILEKTKPTAAIISPTEGSVLGTASQKIQFNVKDEGGSGLNMSSITLKINGVAVTSGISYTDGNNGEKIGTYNASGLSDGANRIQLSVQDNDGNASSEAIINFVISTAAPTLNVTSPANNLITNSNKVTVAGNAAAGSDVVTLEEVTINGTRADITGGLFSIEKTLEKEGENILTIIARDNLGKTTTVTRVVILDTKAPIISDVKAELTTVNAGGRIRITFKVVDE